MNPSIRTMIIVLAFLLPFYMERVMASENEKITGHHDMANTESSLLGSDYFVSTLKKIAVESNTTFLIEGTSLNRSSKSKDIEEILQNATNLNETVSRFAAAFDYDVRREGNLFLLSKRYSDFRDLPPVTLEECSRVAQNILHMLSFHSPDPPRPRRQDLIKTPYGMSLRHPLLADFMASLTDEQLHMMKEKQLKISSLSPVQQAQVRRVALYLYIQTPKESIGTALLKMKWALTSGACIRWKEQNGIRYLGYESPSIPNSLKFVRLAASQERNPSDFPSALHGSSQVTEGVDNAALKSKQVHIAPRSEYTTIGSFVTALNGQRNSDKLISIDEVLVEKPITVISPNMNHPLDAISGMSSLYNLRLTKNKDNSLFLSTRSWQVSFSLDSIPKSIWETLPSSLSHALLLDNRTNLTGSIRQTGSRISDNTIGGVNSRSIGMPNQLKVSINRREELMRQALRAFRATVEPKLHKSQDGKLLIADLSNDERIAFTNILMAGFLEAVQVFAGNELPHYLVDFDDTILVGGVYKDASGKPKFGLSFGHLVGKRVVSTDGIEVDFVR